MRTTIRLPRAQAAALWLTMGCAAVAGSPPKASDQSPSSPAPSTYATAQSLANPGPSFPYRSEGSGPAGPGAPQAYPTAGAGVPTIATVPMPYRSDGPQTLSGMGTPQMITPGVDEAGGPSGIAAVPQPYPSTLTPGSAVEAVRSAAAAAAATPGDFLPGATGPGAPSSGLGGVGSAPPSAFAMVGDLSPIVSFASPPGLPGGNRPPKLPPLGSRSLIAPSVRGFKISENQSPIPQDRVFFGFNYYNNVSDRLLQAFEAPIKNVQIYRYYGGFEKTFNQGLGSFGLRLPMNSVFAQSREPSLNSGGNSAALGDLSVFLKHVFYVDPGTGSLTSGGIAISPRTAGRRFGGAQFLAPSNTTSFQPFVGFFLNFDKLYFHGFSALDVPIDSQQPLLFYNDFGLGYYLYNDLNAAGLITAVAPTVEVHVNTPLNHRGAYDRIDKFGTPDIVNITGGLNVRLGRSSNFTFGAVTPVTGPRPFNIEATALVNVYYGRSRRSAPAFPVVGN